MRKHLSVMMLCISRKVKYFCILLLLMPLVNIGGFYLLGGMNDWPFATGKAKYLLLLAFVLAYVVCLVVCDDELIKSKGFSYTIWKLQISERAYFLWDCLVCSICFAIVWCLEIGCIFVLTFLYSRHFAASQDLLLSTGLVSSQVPQAVTMAIYRNAFLHGLLPLAETGLWFRNLVVVICSGIITAHTSLQARHSSKYVFSFAGFIGVCIVQMNTSVGSEVSYIYTVILAFISAIALGWGLIKAHDGKRRMEE